MTYNKINKIREIKVDSSNNERIDVYLSQILNDFSRSHIQKLIAQKLVQLNSKIALKRDIVKLGDIILIQIPEPEILEVVPQDIKLDIIFEDEYLIVINKPRGLVVHPANGHSDNTLVNALLYHCGNNLSDINGVFRPGIIHRIDKDTTGLLVVAKTQSAHIALSEQLKEHNMQREYLALVHGIINRDFQKIDLNIGRSSKDRKKMAITSSDSGKRAVTNLEVIKRFDKNINNKFTYLKCKLETGRTHQIRVHMAYINHSVVGDKTYGLNKKIDNNLQGQLLHAYKIKFIHPKTGQQLEFTTKIPEDFELVLEKLNKLDL